jgi:hypothetical protein
MPAGPSFIIRPAVIGDAEAIGEMAREFTAYLQALGEDVTYRLTPERIGRDGFGPTPPSRESSPTRTGRCLAFCCITRAMTPTARSLISWSAICSCGRQGGAKASAGR